MGTGFVRGIGIVAAFSSALLLAGVASAQTKWDASVPWGPSEYHTKNLIRFAAEIGRVTDGRIEVTVHAGGSLGIKGPESLRAVSDGIVPMAEMAGFQQTGEEPLLGFEALPFLINNFDELEDFVSRIRPLYAAAFERNNQKLIYMVPWPSQNIFTKTEVHNLGDIDGMRIRTYNKTSTELMTAIGMSPALISSPDIVPILAAGGLDAVVTSATTAVAQKYWEFLKHTYQTNHLWALNEVTINMDAWNAISAADQKAIMGLAAELEPQFWDVARGEDTIMYAKLKENGMTVGAPAADFLAALQKSGKEFWGAFTDTVDGSKPILDKFLADMGK